MKNIPASLRRLPLLALALLLAAPVLSRAAAPPATIPFDQLGAHATKNYSGDGLALTPTAEGARLRCDFQRLAGTLGPDGLWLRSTATDASGTPFRVRAATVGREAAAASADSYIIAGPGSAAFMPQEAGAAARVREAAVASPLLRLESRAPGALAAAGTVEAGAGLARWVRPGLVEEFSVSVDGVRQDFVVAARPTARVRCAWSWRWTVRGRSPLRRACGWCWRMARASWLMAG